MIAYLILFIVFLFCIYVLAQWYVQAEPKDVIKVLKWTGIGAVLVAFLFLILSGRLGWAFSILPVLFVWLGRFRRAWFIGRLLNNFFGSKKQEQADQQSQNRSASPSNEMSREEALSILGLDEDAMPEEIKAAYHRLISQVHPDRGGSDYLAAKINQAKDTLLND